MGSGHFLVEACRFLARHLYEACRLCDERALAAERRAEAAASSTARDAPLDEAARWRERLGAVPDPDQELVKYLPSRAPEGLESGYSQRKAEALCRRLVAVHCLYGVDKNPLAVELAKLALWIEAHAEGLPLTFLDHRLVVGDSLTGPFFEHLLAYPASKAQMDDLLTFGLRQTFTAAIGEALKHVGELEASTGVTLADIEAKQAAKARLDRALAPFRIVAAAWAGGVMLGRDLCDDPGYANLVRHVSEHRELPPGLDPGSPLCRTIARGLGVEALPATPAEVLALIGAAASIPALPYDLAFAEVFFPLGLLSTRQGFDAVLGNPPWDRLLPADKEFFASYEFSVLDAPTKRERTAIEDRLLADRTVNAAHESYVETFRSGERIADRLYAYQIAVIDGERTIGKQDAFRLFMERKAQLLAGKGVVGVVVPSAFHANEGATGVRRLYIAEMAVRCCYSFENRRKLFEIDSRFKFALVVAARQGPTSEFACAFYLHDDEWLFREGRREELVYTRDFVRRTGGEYLSLLELRTARDLEIAHSCFSNGEPFGGVCERLGIRLGRELNMTDDAWRFTPTGEVLPGGEDPRDPDVARRLLDLGYLVLHEGKTFRQYDDHWGDRPRYVVSRDRLADRESILGRARFFRLGYRDIAGPGDQNVSIFNVHPPGITTGHTAPLEHRPFERPNSAALLLLAVLNTLSFDWLLQLRVRSHLNQFMLLSTPLPTGLARVPTKTCLAHGALRLTCNHAGYTRLWSEQTGDAWREQKSPGQWPVLASNDERWAARTAMDALVADAYGLSREQYAHILSTFRHSTYPKAPDLCLQRFDELKAVGPEAFTRRHDPYWDIPLNENLPQPVIELPLPAAVAEPQGELYGSDRDVTPLRKVAEEARGYGNEGPRRARRASSRRGNRERRGR